MSCSPRVCAARTETKARSRDAASLIGNTPCVRLSKLVTPADAEVWLKLEGQNPGGSVKDRIALTMIEDAERRGVLRAGMTVVEPTSGNTGIGLALVCGGRGLRCLLVMPESMSTERRALLRAYGAELELTPAAGGMSGAVARTREIAASDPDRYYMPMQFENPANPAAHIATGREILADPGPPLDAFISGVGTGGTVTGAGRVLREALPGLLIVAVEPSASPVLSGGSPAPHRIQGIGAGFVPPVLDRSLIDRIIQVDDARAALVTRQLASQEGLFLGISSGAAAAAALDVARELGVGRRVVAIAPDRGDRYLSTGLWDGGDM
ncbi:MAG: cysteine synthase A [Bacillota bacterium]|nr:cysteine synthase A [Bacillota bacterium]